MSVSPPRTGTIVVGTDGSDGAERALHWAMEESSLRGTAVQAVIAVDPACSTVTSLAAGEEVAARVRAQVERADLDAEVSIGVHEGAAVDVLVGVAAGAQLLVVGSHGTSSMVHNALGSVSDVLARVSPCPVVILPMGAV